MQDSKGTPSLTLSGKFTSLAFLGSFLGGVLPHTTKTIKRLTSAPGQLEVTTLSTVQERGHLCSSGHVLLGELSPPTRVAKVAPPSRQEGGPAEGGAEGSAFS